ncbi:hypothetical protein LZ31DRAFT_4973 [Colletotrichum somersetense]|nr:hypothetical protein LZ31DRAFT_4973 [Colletotrichum somersetense]
MESCLGIRLARHRRHGYERRCRRRGGQGRLRAERSRCVDPGHPVGRPHWADEGRSDIVPGARPQERRQHGLPRPPLSDYVLVRHLPPFGDGAPKELVVAAVVAAVPLFFEGVRDIKPKPDGDGNVDYFRWMYAIFLVATDALGGYVFARMAANQGMPISNYHAACSTGAVYGTLTFLSRSMTGCVALVRIRTADGKVSDIFGVWEAVLPDKIIVTEEEYLRMQRGLAATLTQFFGTGPSMLRSLFNCGGCCCFFSTRGRKAAKEMREDFFGDDEMAVQARHGANVMAQGLFIAMTGDPQHKGDSPSR